MATMGVAGGSSGRPVFVPVGSSVRLSTQHMWNCSGWWPGCRLENFAPDISKTREESRIGCRHAEHNAARRGALTSHLRICAADCQYS
jgi:hypothetical protein